ncbi:MAG: SDR family oxidoreductase [Anaerolinea sp.]|nr:SDR family oxidoreductase [Anaerolinea sp.]
MPRRDKIILITGASSGIGRRTASYLAAQGHTVFGTSRRPHTDWLDGFQLLPLDVTDAESVRACVSTVLNQARHIDVLIANAGIDYFGALEETPIADAEHVFAVNFFGAARVVNAVLPAMRARRQGQIILMSSALGRAAWPFEGYYCASKFALEGYAEALCYEMNLFGIKVSAVEPGFFKSNMIARQGYAPPIADYAHAREHALRLGLTWAEQAPDPLPVARAISRIIDSARPALRYTVGLEAHLAPPLAHLLPLSARFKVGRWMLGQDDPRRDALRFGVATAGITALIALIRGWLLRSRHDEG